MSILKYNILMTKKTRTILFFVCVFLFLLVAPFVIFYSQGYRINFETKKITKTGGIFLKIEPRQAEIYLNEKLNKKTDLFFGSALIENLLPRKYKISIKKNGYQNWEKNLEVKEGLVTEAKNIILIPQSVNFQILSNNVNDYFLSPDEKKLVFKKEKESGWYLTMFDLEKNIESVLIEEKNISQKKADFSNLQWSPDSKKIILEVLIGNEKKYYILEINSPLPIVPILINLPENAENISFSQLDSQKLFFLKEKNLFEINYKTKMISEPILNNLLNYKIDGDNILYLDISGFMYSYNLISKNQEKLNIEPFQVKEGASYEIFSYLPKIFLKENNVFFQLKSNTKNFEKIFDLVKNLEFSSDKKKLLFFNNNEIWILYLEDILTENQKKAGDLQLLCRFSESIENVFWLTNYYVIFSVGDKIKIAEIDERDKIQIWDFDLFKSDVPPKISFSQKNKELYILSKNFYKSEKLIK